MNSTNMTDHLLTLSTNKGKSLIVQKEKLIINIAVLTQTNKLTRGLPIIKGNKANFVDPKELILAFLVLLINLSLFFFILGRKTLRKRKSHQLFVNICVVHILSAVSIIASNYSEVAAVQTYMIINIGLLLEMLEMLMVLSCERVLAIKYSFKYVEVRSKHILALLVCTWILPCLYVIVGILLGFSEKSSLISSTALINTATVTLGITNLIIYRIAKKHDKFLKENAMVNKKSVTNVKSLKASYICFAIVASFMVLWTPYCVHNIILLSKWHAQMERNDGFSQAVDLIAYLHGVVDPIFFVWLSQATKKEIGKMMTMIRSKLRKEDSERSLQTDTTKSTS